MSSFDLQRHRLNRLRAAERRADALDAYRVRLERLLALALIAACADTDVTPEAMLDAIERLDNVVQADAGPIPPERLTGLIGGPS